MILRIALLMVSYMTLVSCGPLTAVSAIGSTITNYQYNEANRDLRNPNPSREEQALEVAYANMTLGVEYMRQGDYQKALNKLERSLAAKSDFAPSYNVLGLLYQKLGDKGQAEKNFKQSIRLDPADSSFKNNYGLFLCAEGRVDEAIDSFQDAADNPLYDSPEIALTNAGLCSLKDNPALAETYFMNALDKNPSFSYALLQMADISFNKSEYQAAYDYFQRYRQNARQTPKSLWLGIRICNELDYKDDVSSYALLLKK